MKEKIYYIYAAYVDGVLRYIGKGSGDRYKHCTSGRSSCVDLNIDLFNGKKIEVKKIRENLSEREALNAEALLIEVNYDTLYNKKKGLPEKDEDIPLSTKLLQLTKTINTETGEEYDVTITDKLVYSVLSYKINKDDPDVSYKAISEVLGISHKTVGRSIEQLEKAGMICVDRSCIGGANSYKIVDYEGTLDCSYIRETQTSKIRTTSFTKGNYAKNNRNSKDFQ